MLQIENVFKAFNPQTPVLAAIDLTIQTGEIVCLLGPSGCGKTTLLRIVAGLEQADRGVVAFDQQNLAQVPVHKRNFGLMFQDFALFPHKTVGENIAFGLQMAGQAKTQMATRVAEMLALVNLRGYGDRSIFALSGGERQRVALARSLAPQPRLLMLDEPLGSLDRTLREELMTELRRILKQLGVTALYVTHDQQEAFAIADRLAVMHRGRIEQIGTPTAVYHKPANAFVAAFLGFNNLLPVEVTDRTNAIATPIGAFPAPVHLTPGTYVLLIRPQAATFLPVAAPDAPALRFKAQIETCSFRGDYYQVQVKLLHKEIGQWLTFVVTPQPGVQLAVGEMVDVVLDPALLTLLPASLPNG